MRTQGDHLLKVAAFNLERRFSSAKNKVNFSFHELLCDFDEVSDAAEMVSCAERGRAGTPALRQKSVR